MEIKLTDEYGFLEKGELLFTFELDGEGCFVYRDGEKDIICRKMKWSLWHGAQFDGELADERALDFANAILERAQSAPSFFCEQGEHYKIAEKDGKTKIVKTARSPLLSPVLKTVPVLLRWAAVMAAAILYAFIYINGDGFAWGYALFPKAEHSTLLFGMYAWQIAAATAFFVLKRDRHFVFEHIFDIFVPLNLITFVGLVKYSAAARAALLAAGIGMFAVCMLIKAAKVIIRNKKERKIGSIKSLISVLSTVFCFCLILSTACAGVLGVRGAAYVSEETPYSEEEEILEEKYYSTLDNIQKTVWEGLSPEEKLDTLQVICDYECRIYLGCTGVEVKAGYMEENLLGEYSNLTGVITLNAEYLENGDVTDVVETLLHEVRHVWQHEIADMYSDIEGKLDEKYKNLDLFKDARKFRYNFDTYSGGGDYVDYYTQAVEEDSRSWAQESMREFYIYRIVSEE